MSADIQNSIYSDVSAFSAAKEYVKNNVVTQSGNYRYALVDKAAGAAFVEADWGGIKVDAIDGKTRPHFFWKPSYGNSSNHTPRVQKIRFGDGYEQRVKEGINHKLLNFDFSFDNRDLKEAFSILHFLEQRAAIEAFLFEPYLPLKKVKRFVCDEWSDSRVFYDNYSIQVRFREVPS